MHPFLLSSTCRAAGHRWTLIALALAGAPALAQTAAQPEPQTQLAPVVVVGQAAAIDRALDDQEAADNIVSVVRADGIGRLPDKNAAEAVQRLPGVSIERDQGEGRYVRIRGLGPDMNTVTLNGALVPSPERDRRAVMLDVLPSALIRSLVVTKTQTPDQDANAIGGTIDVQSLSAFDHAGSFVNLEAGYAHETNTDRDSPNAALAWSDLFLDGRLGAAVGLSYDKRQFGSDNVETGGAWDGDALEEFQRRDYRITRERTGASLNLEFKPDTLALYFLRASHSRYSDEEVRQRHNIEFDEAQEAGVLGDAESSRELKARKETQTISSLTLGTDQRLGDWKLQIEAGASRAEEDTPMYANAASFEADDLFSGVGYADGSRPQLIAPAAVNDAASYTLSDIELERTLVTDREHHLRLDLGRKLDVFGTATDLKFGAKFSRRKKDNAQTTWKVEDLDQAPFNLSDAQRSLLNFSGAAASYPWGSFGPTINPAAVRALLNGVDLASYIDEEESTINNFRMHEDIDAAYVQTGFEAVGWRWLAGVRHEGTRFKAEGTGVKDGDFVANNVERSYGHWLPGVHARRNLDDDTAVRAAWTYSVVRPTFGQLAPGYVIDGDEAEFGNPSLEPLKSTNLDLGIERRLGYAGVLSAYVFHKRIRNFVYQTDLAGTGDWVDFDEAITYANGDKARVSGVELAYTQTFRHLNGFWRNFIVGANATFTRSKAHIARWDADAGAMQGRDIALPSQSDRVFNLTLGYETPDFGVRIAANRKSRYLLEVTDVLDGSRDLYVDAQTQIDLSARYAVSKRLSVVFEALNLNDGAYYVYTGDAARNAQYETYGRTYRLNLKYALY